MKKIIYFDYAGSTPVGKKVSKKMRLYQKRIFANASAIFSMGIEAHSSINKAREKIAKIINAHPDEIIFTGSGTESIALALNKDGHIVTTNIEHLAVLNNCKNVTLVPVGANGIVDPRKIHEAIKEDTVLVSVMYANNEIGTIQPIQEIAKEIRYYRKKNKTKFPFFHTDACQAMNYLEINNIEKLGVDLLSFNSSKIYGPKGVGVLYKKRGVELSPLYSGGGQEFELRPGTENVAGIVGVAEALGQVCKIKEKESKRLIELRDYLIDKLKNSQIIKNFGILINGDLEKRLSNNINFSISGISSELLVIELDAKGFCVSEKSACSGRKDGSSHVIKALREAENDTLKTFENSIRISLGQQTKKRDLNKLIKALEQILLKYQEWK